MVLRKQRPSSESPPSSHETLRTSANLLIARAGSISFPSRSLTPQHPLNLPSPVLNQLCLKRTSLLRRQPLPLITTSRFLLDRKCQKRVSSIVGHRGYFDESSCDPVRSSYPLRVGPQDDRCQHQHLPYLCISPICQLHALPIMIPCPILDRCCGVGPRLSAELRPASKGKHNFLSSLLRGWSPLLQQPGRVFPAVVRASPAITLFAQCSGGGRGRPNHSRVSSYPLLASNDVNPKFNPDLAKMCQSLWFAFIDRRDRLLRCVHRSVCGRFHSSLRSADVLFRHTTLQVLTGLVYDSGHTIYKLPDSSRRAKQLPFVRRLTTWFIEPHPAPLCFSLRPSLYDRPIVSSFQTIMSLTDWLASQKHSVTNKTALCTRSPSLIFLLSAHSVTNLDLDTPDEECMRSSSSGPLIESMGRHDGCCLEPNRLPFRGRQLVPKLLRTSRRDPADSEAPSTPGPKKTACSLPDDQS